MEKRARRCEYAIQHSSLTGLLTCLDGYMNVALEDTEEWAGGKITGRYGDCFLRGNNGESHRTGPDGQSLSRVQLSGARLVSSHSALVIALACGESEGSHKARAQKTRCLHD